MTWPTDITFTPTVTTDVVTSEPLTGSIDPSLIRRKNEENLIIGLVLGYLAAIFLGDIL